MRDCIHRCLQQPRVIVLHCPLQPLLIFNYHTLRLRFLTTKPPVRFTEVNAVRLHHKAVYVAIFMTCAQTVHSCYFAATPGLGSWSSWKVERPTSCLPRCVSETPRLRINPTTHSPASPARSLVLSISLRFPVVFKKAVKSYCRYSRLLTCRRIIHILLSMQALSLTTDLPPYTWLVKTGRPAQRERTPFGQRLHTLRERN
jgi:hypothetical protein